MQVSRFPNVIKQPMKIEMERTLTFLIHFINVRSLQFKIDDAKVQDCVLKRRADELLETGRSE